MYVELIELYIKQSTGISLETGCITIRGKGYTGQPPPSQTDPEISSQEPKNKYNVYLNGHILLFFLFKLYHIFL